ncbi:hypothetical protein D7V97_05180 [Corallococcus sp. CA053C]|uniref:hypothetical protein n=1 Tax=Corallococcus sp. CA053C TaxID=2316732 RepID=UPI000EA3D23B|nr:hypothetical protein [Corallococcus sp. CA053C]RKH13609.1 hypothetical protein D7V97_05180 [Corallococcus sp. CA053C]
MSPPDHSPLDTVASVASVKGTKAADTQLKSYYCLQRSVGNIPPEAVTAHAAFFEWLGCGP